MGQAATGRDPAWLVLRAQSGDREALEDLLLHAQEMLRPYVRAMLRDDAHAADVLQDVLVRVYRKLGALREPRAFDAWARRIAAREVFRALRRRRAGARTEELPPNIPADTPQPAADEGLLKLLPSLLERVSPASRAVLVLHYLEGLTIDEVGAVLDLPSGTVKSRLAYGLATLRRLVPAAAP